MSFRTTFIAVFLGGSLLLAAVLVNRARPESDLAHPSADRIRGTLEQLTRLRDHSRDI